uniref:Uncharacterized protein n=1 Tax=Ascaris lumbricoides TaxID=6252 RepID=A0A0M3IHP3_ASCLU
MHAESMFTDTNNVAAKSTANERLLEANRQSTSTVTLDDIIASARRKVSDDYVEPPLPQNILTAVHNGKLSYAERESTILNVTPRSTVNEVTRIEDILTEESSFTRKLLDSDSDTFLSCEPPSLEADDDLTVNFRAARPTDIYSNPIMYSADPLFSTSKKNYLMDREISLGNST